ncbi:transcription factor Opi1-domain-containing protein [Mycotypha africana]|uniref:transcription factor Opi1-domain-containing protein n=1 Tax=Mycotypha africana TaxID=64632 RepID=UPI0023012AC8|nr:transcription factor Opi1-domain-containing protein [Mycotypha africana]KAI8975253.1 transcription factor Opi1-domain-containing protein [Mycotypha africana]
MSINELVHSSDTNTGTMTNTTGSIASLNDIEDPDVKLAAEVLGGMARLSSTNTNTRSLGITLPPLSTPSTTPSSPLPTPTTSSLLHQQHQQRLSFSSESTLDDENSQYYQQQHTSQQPLHRHNNSLFIHRVSNIPIVNSALKAYEHSKSTNSVMKYGAEMMESFAAPIYDKFGKQALSNVDEWGCKQLDKLEQKYPNYVIPHSKRQMDDKPKGTKQNGKGLKKVSNKAIADDTAEQVENAPFSEEDEDDARSATFALSRASLTDDHTVAADTATNTIVRKRKDARVHHHHSRSTSPHNMRNSNAAITKPIPSTAATTRYHHHHPNSIVRNKWHQIVLHASSAASTTAAVISEESMKCLKYCLHWLQYASQHIDQQMNLLHQFLDNKKLQMEREKAVVVEAEDSSILRNIKKEIIDTLRKVVDVISKYAGAGLPEQAKTAVRGFILALPSRWAKLNQLQSSSTASTTPNSTTITTTATIALNNNLHETSIKLLNFGTEAIDMIHSVTQVFSDTIDRAELWIHRLKVVGVTAPSTRVNSRKQSRKPTSSLTEKQATTNNAEPMDLS